MSTHSKNSLFEDDDDDQDYIPVGVLQVSPFRKPVYLENSQLVASASEEVNLRVSYNQKQPSHAASFQQTSYNLPQLEKLDVGDINLNPVQSKQTNAAFGQQAHPSQNQFQLSEKDEALSRLVNKEERPQDPLQKYKILFQMMQQQQKAQSQGNNNNEVSSNCAKPLEKVVRTSVKNVSPGAYDSQRQFQQKLSSEDFNSNNVPFESKNQLLRILTQGQEGVSHSGHLLLQRVQEQDPECNTRGSEESNIKAATSLAIESSRLVPITQISPHTTLKIDIASSTHHIPVPKLKEQSPTSASSASGFSFHHPNVNHQHPEISRRLNSPVSPGRQPASPRQAVSPRHAGSPRQMSASPCQFVSPKQPASPRGVNTAVGTWKSQPPSPQPFHPPSPKFQACPTWQPPSPSAAQIIPPKRPSSTPSDLPNQATPSSAPLTSPTSRLCSAEGVSHHLSGFQPTLYSSSRVSPSGGIVHHRPVLEATRNTSHFTPSGSSYEKFTSIHTQAVTFNSSPLQSNNFSASSVLKSKPQTDEYKIIKMNDPIQQPSTPLSQGSVIPKEETPVISNLMDDETSMCTVADNSIFQENRLDLKTRDSKNAVQTVQGSVKSKSKANSDTLRLSKEFLQSGDNFKDNSNLVEGNEDIKSKESHQTVDVDGGSEGVKRDKGDLSVGSEYKELREDVKMEEVGGDTAKKPSKKMLGSEEKSKERGLRSKRTKMDKKSTTNDVQDSVQDSVQYSVQDGSTSNSKKENVKGDEISKTSARETTSKRLRKPKVPFENSASTSEKDKRVEKNDRKIHPKIVERKRLKEEQPKPKRGSSNRLQSMLTRSGLQTKSFQVKNKTGKKVIARTRAGQFMRSSSSRKSRDVKRGNMKLDMKSTQETDKESEKEKRGNRSVKEQEKEGKKGSTNNKEPSREEKKKKVADMDIEKGERKGSAVTREQKKEESQLPLSKESDNSKVSETATRGSLRLSARQAMTPDKSKISGLSNSRSQNQEVPKISDNSSEEGIATRSKKSTTTNGQLTKSSENLFTRGMTTRQSDGTLTLKRHHEFVESLPLSSRKRSKSEVIASKDISSGDKTLNKMSDSRSPKSKPRSHKNTAESDEDDEYFTEDEEDDDDEEDEEEDSGDDSISPKSTRSKRMRFPKRKMSMSLRREARKRKYHIEEESVSDESLEDEESSDLDNEDIVKSVQENSSLDVVEKNERKPLSAVSASGAVTKQPALKTEVKEINSHSSLSEQIAESATLVTKDCSQLMGFRLVPMSAEEMAKTPGSELVVPFNGFLLPGTDCIFFPPQYSEHLKKETTLSSVSIHHSGNSMSTSSNSQSKSGSNQSIPTCTRVLVTPRPISSVSDSGMKTSAFSCPSPRPSSRDHHSSHSNSKLLPSMQQGSRHPTTLPTAPTPPPATMSMGLSASRVVASSAPTTLPWSSPSHPTPPPSVSSSSSHSSTSWNPVANLQWQPDTSSSAALWNNEHSVGNNDWRNMARETFGDDLVMNTDMALSRQEGFYHPNDSGMLHIDPDSGLFRDSSNVSPSSYNLAIPGLVQQDITYLESNLRQDMDISSSLLMAEGPYTIHESVTNNVHQDSNNLVCSVNLDDADVGGLGSAASTLHLPHPSGLDNLNAPPPPPPPPLQIGFLAMKDDRNLVHDEEIKLRSEQVDDNIRSSLEEDVNKPDVVIYNDSIKSGEKSLSMTNTRRHLFEICIVDDKKLGRCKICSNAYSLTSIYRHLKKHDNPDFGFHCDICGKKYSQKHHLLVHLKRVHDFGPSAESLADETNKEAKESSEMSVSNQEGMVPSNGVAKDKGSPVLTGIEKQPEPKGNIEGKEGKKNEKKIRKRSGEGRSTKDGLIYEEMPDSPNAISAEKERETQRQVERFRKMKARKKFAVQRKLSGITFGLSQLEDSGDDEAKTISGSAMTSGEHQIKSHPDQKSDDDTVKMTKSSLGREMRLEEFAIPAAFEKDLIKMRSEENTSREEIQGHEKWLQNSSEDPGDLVPGESCEAPVGGPDTLSDLVLGGEGMDGVGEKWEEGLVEIPDGSKGKFPCSLCKRVLSSKCSYLMHMRRHNNAKDKFCSYCGKGFITGQELRSHQRTHTGERPFTCDICKHTFAHSGSCQAHRRGHIKRGETEPFPPEKCYNGKPPVRRNKRTVSDDGGEKRHTDSKGQLLPSFENDRSGSAATESSVGSNDLNHADNRRRSLDSSLLQKNLELNESQMGNPWPAAHSDLPQTKVVNSVQGASQVIALESSMTPDLTAQSRNTSLVTNFRDQSSPSFYAPSNQYGFIPEGPGKVPKDHQIRNQVVSPNHCHQSQSFTQRSEQSNQLHHASFLHTPSFNAALKTPSQPVNSAGNQTYGYKNTSQMFASPGPVTTSSMNQGPSSTSQHNVPPGNYNNSSQQYMYQANASPNYSSPAIQQQQQQHHHKQQSGGMLKSLMSQYNTPSPSYKNAPTTTTTTSHAPMDFAIQQGGGSHHPYLAERSPLPSLSQSPMQQQQNQLPHHPQIPQPSQFHHHQPPTTPQHHTSSQQALPPTGRHLQQLLTQQNPPPPYTGKKTTTPTPTPPPPPYPYNEYFPQKEVSQTPFKSPNNVQHVLNSFNASAYNNTTNAPNYFQSTSASSSSSSSANIRPSQTGVSSDSRSPMVPKTNFSQPAVASSGPRTNASPLNSSSSPAPSGYQYHHPPHPPHPHRHPTLTSTNAAAPNSDYFHQGPPPPPPPPSSSSSSSSSG